MIKSALFYAFIVIISILVTFFGLGPVLFADGSMQERMITLAIVLLIYIVIGFAVYFYARKKRLR